ncbi:MAG: RNA polymerase sigma-54 factor, partial [Bacteroidia bacterium]|nr:RNA polymerase sigma-54 factor [Bacteroidia bacterium]
MYAEQKLQQKLLQKLSPQQIQMIKLLEIPTINLEQRIKNEIEENPALEEGAEQLEDEELITDNNNDEDNDEDFSIEDYLNDEEIPSYKLATRNYSPEYRSGKKFLFQT